jgi:hypothetical protein
MGNVGAHASTGFGFGSRSGRSTRFVTPEGVRSGIAPRSSRRRRRYDTDAPRLNARVGRRGWVPEGRYAPPTPGSTHPLTQPARSTGFSSLVHKESCPMGSHPWFEPPYSRSPGGFRGFSTLVAVTHGRRGSIHACANQQQPALVRNHSGELQNEELQREGAPGALGRRGATGNVEAGCVTAGGSGAAAERMFGRLGKWWAAACAYELLESALAGRGGTTMQDVANSSNSSAIGGGGGPAAAENCCRHCCRNCLTEYLEVSVR